MYNITIYNHETQKDVKQLSFETKRKANKFLKDNTEKRGYSFFSKTNKSLEYNKKY